MCGTLEREAIGLLQFLAFAERPLTPSEAIDIVAVDMTQTPSFDPINRIPDPLEIAEVCSSLVVLDLGNKRLQLAHFSVKEYLVSERVRLDFREHFKETSAHYSITKICLGYLESVLPSVPRDSMSFSGLLKVRNSDQEKKPSWNRELRRFPLMEYAIYTWPAHARRCSQHKDIAMRIQRFLEQKSSFIKWLFYFSTSRYYPVQVDESEGPEVSCPTLLCIYLDLPEIALYMINNDFRLETELISEDVLHFLGSDLGHSSGRPLAYKSCDGRYYMTSHIYLATEKGMHNVVKSLIKRGIAFHEDGGRWGTALNLACYQCSEDIIATLLHCSRDFAPQECHEKYIRGALDIIIQRKAGYGPDKMIPIRNQLVKFCQSLENPGSLLDCCLKTVFLDFNLDLAKILVQNGACVDLIDSQDLGNMFSSEEFLLSFLHLFVGEESGNVDPNALQKLFTAEFPDKPYSMIYQTILLHFNKALCFMVSHGANRECYVPLVQFRSKIVRCTALFMAVEQRNTMAVQFLLNVNKRVTYEEGFAYYTPPIHYINESNGHRKETCLHVAAKNNETEIMKALISCEAALEAEDVYSRTPLHHACKHNSLEAIKLLVEYGANLQALDYLERTPLQVASDPGRYEFERRETSKAVIEWLEQRNSEISSDDGSYSKRQIEADNDESFYAKRDSKHQKTG